MAAHLLTRLGTSTLSINCGWAVSMGMVSASLGSSRRAPTAARLRHKRAMERVHMSARGPSHAGSQSSRARNPS
eukprot:1895786-Alexandrium_andersonii.AAC.1